MAAWRVEWPLTLVPCADDCANIGRADSRAPPQCVSWPLSSAWSRRQRSDVNLSISVASSSAASGMRLPSSFRCLFFGTAVEGVVLVVAASASWRSSKSRSWSSCISCSQSWGSPMAAARRGVGSGQRPRTTFATRPSAGFETTWCGFTSMPFVGAPWTIFYVSSHFLCVQAFSLVPQDTIGMRHPRSGRNLSIARQIARRATANHA